MHFSWIQLYEQPASTYGFDNAQISIIHNNGILYHLYCISKFSFKTKVMFMKYYNLRYSCRWVGRPKTKCTSFHDIHRIFIVYIVPWMGHVLMGLKCLIGRLISQIDQNCVCYVRVLRRHMPLECPSIFFIRILWHGCQRSLWHFIYN